MPKARGSLLVARCVRDWSGILCERSDNAASKDTAESPTRSGTPKKFKSLSSTALVLKNNKYKKLSDKRPADAVTFDFDLKDSGTFVLAQDINFFESFTKNRKKLQKN